MIKRDVEESLQRMYERGYKKGYDDALKKNKGEWEDKFTKRRNISEKESDSSSWDNVTSDPFAGEGW